jgi:Holliday junction resolvase RusA-like endonuclease
VSHGKMLTRALHQNRKLEYYTNLKLQSFRTKVAVKIAECLHWRFQKIAVEISVKIASLNRS